MLVLYSSNTTSFSNLGLGVLRDFYSNPTITEVLNAEYNLEFEYVSGGWLCEDLIRGNIIKANGQLFRIWDIEQDLQKIKVLAKHIFFDLSKNFLEDVAPTNLTANNAISWLLNRTASSNSFNVTGDCTDTASARYVRKNVIDAIYNEDNAILKRFGGEIELNNYDIYVHKKRGNDTGFSVLYGKNLSGIQMSLDLSTVATRIMPQGKDELLLDELYVDSPLINNYFAPFYQKIEFSDIGVDEDNNIDEDTAKDLLRAAVQKLYVEGIDKPTISIKVDFIELSKTTEYKEYQNLESVSLGDTITAKIPKLNLNIETRVVKTVYDLSLDRIISIECGTVTPNIVTKQYQSSQEIINRLERVDVDSILSQAQINATNLINHPFNACIFIDKQHGELCIMNTDDPTTATQVWKWGLGGLGFSSNGISGPFGIAITQDGRINADYITTGTLSASVIEGYSDLLIAVNEIVNLTNTIENENYIYITNAMEGPLQELTIEGVIQLLHPSNSTKPSNSLYPLDTYLVVDKSVNPTSDIKKYHLPLTGLSSGEKFKIIKGKCYLVHTDESIDVLDDLYIDLFDGTNYIYLESFQNNINLTATYVIKSKYTTTFATKLEMNSAINITKEEINLEVSKKVDGDEVVSRINQSADKITLSSNRLEINSDNFNLSEDGTIEAKAGTIGGFTLSNNSLSVTHLPEYSEYTIEDVRIVTDHIANGTILTDEQILKYDINGDGVVTTSDLLYIQNYVYIRNQNVKIEINSDDYTKFLSVVSDNFGTALLVSLGGITTNLLNANSIHIVDDNDDSIFTIDRYGSIVADMTNSENGLWTIINNEVQKIILTKEGAITCVSLTQTSKEENKKNFEKLKNAKEILKSTDIYKYNFIEDEDTAKKHIGLVIGDKFNYSEDITAPNNDGVDIYSMISVLWQVVKEQQEEIDKLKEEIKNGVH